MIPELTDLERLARQAGEILREGYGQRHHINLKGAIDLVTEIDQRSEELLLNEIHQHFPDHRILAEESGAQTGDDCCQWLVDPLDGTVNYAHGVPIFCVSIAFRMQNETILGVVYDPMRDECFTARKGDGAWLNGAAIHVSDTADLDDSLMVTGFHYDIRTMGAPENNLHFHNRFSLLTRGVRRLGSAALDLCYVASGRIDGYWEMKLSPWDLAAGALIAVEAGARVSGVFGQEDYFYPYPSILAANPKLFQKMLAVLTEQS